MSISIKFENISKQYRLGLVSTQTLSHDLNRWWKINVLGADDPYLKIGEVNDRSLKGESDYVWALKNIDFEVQQGDVLGIIGNNGAGKSTLLKILSNVTSPTTGSIKARGRIASLLEVGTGFHPEMTGRENIYMNGSIMGMSKLEITRKLDEIVDFSGVERYLDTPVKRYSSGMTVRLGFAIAAHLEPEILVVDEVLAVGDAEFQKKAIGKMQDVSKGEGRTVLFVSHNMAAVKNLCTKGVVLNNGLVLYSGDINSAVDTYLHKNEFDLNSEIKNNISWKTHGLDIENISINNSIKPISTFISNQESFTVNIEGYVDRDIKVDIILTIKDINNVPMATFAMGHYEGSYILVKKGKFSLSEEIELPSILAKGNYLVDLFILEPNVEFFLKAYDCAEIHVEGSVDSVGRVFNLSSNGVIGLKRFNS